MIYGRIDGLDKQVSRVVLGTGNVVRGGNPQKYESVMDRAYELGINTIDSGREYADGFSDQCIGNWMERRQNREDMVIISKGCHHNDWRKRVTPFDLASDIHDTLAALKTDYLDLYFLHRDDESVPVEVMIEALNEHQRAGHIRVFGASNWSYTRIAQANAYAEKKGLSGFSATSQHFSLGVQRCDPWGGGCVSLTGEEQSSARDWHKTVGAPIFAYSSLSLGLFSGRVTRENYLKLAEEGRINEVCIKAYCSGENFDRLDRVRQLAEVRNETVPDIAVAYVLNYQDFGGFPTFSLAGAETPAEVESLTHAPSIKLSEREMLWLDLKADTL